MWHSIFLKRSEASSEGLTIPWLEEKRLPMQVVFTFRRVGSQAWLDRYMGDTLDSSLSRWVRGPRSCLKKVIHLVAFPCARGPYSFSWSESFTMVTRHKTWRFLKLRVYPQDSSDHHHSSKDYYCFHVLLPWRVEIKVKKRPRRRRRKRRSWWRKEGEEDSSRASRWLAGSYQQLGLIARKFLDTGNTSTHHSFTGFWCGTRGDCHCVDHNAKSRGERLSQFKPYWKTDKFATREYDLNIRTLLNKSTTTLTKYESFPSLPIYLKSLSNNRYRSFSRGHLGFNSDESSLKIKSFNSKMTSGGFSRLTSSVLPGSQFP